MLERIIVAILAIVAAFFARQHQREGGASRLLDRHIGHVGAYESIRGRIHFKHCSRGIVIDILVHFVQRMHKIYLIVNVIDS